MTLQIKLIILALVAAAFLGLGWTAKHYHNKFVDVTAQLAAQKVSLDTALAAAEKCSEGTRALREAADKKEKEQDEARKVAEAVNQKKQSNSTSILVKAPELPDDLCKSAMKLYESYEKDMAGK